MKYEWLLFDADGTLFDFERAEAAALEEAFLASGFPPEPGRLAAYRRINAEAWLALEQGSLSAADLPSVRFERLFSELGLPLAAEPFGALYLRQLGFRTDLLPDAEETVRTLAGRHRLALITNGLRSVQRERFARSPIRPYIREIVISEEVGAAKPARAFFDAVFEKLGRPDRRTALVIGDSLSSDIEGGMRSGIPTCWFNPAGLPRPPEYGGIDHEIRSLPELRNLLS